MTASREGRWLDRIERVGNALPHPATLFLIGALAVMGISELASVWDWTVEKTVRMDSTSGLPALETATVTLRARSLLSSDGLYWCLESLVDNFKNFPPLAIVLVGMLGIGLAERSGFIGALLKASLQRVPPVLLTPCTFLLGVLSSMALDAGYVVLPPVAAALYHAAGRSPLAGLAAVFAGVSAGFSANLFITGLEPILAGFSESGAHLVDPEYRVAATSNWWFLIASTGVLTAAGWAVTAGYVEPRLASRASTEGGPPEPRENAGPGSLSAEERRGLRFGCTTALLIVACVVAATWLPGAPLHGDAGRFPRWVAAIVPLLFLCFFLPGLAYGIGARKLSSDRAVAELLGQTMASMGPYIVLAFFAAQFIEYFRHSGLGEMMAIAGGSMLAQAALPEPLLIVCFIGLVGLANLFIGSMSAKYAFFAPIFVPMFMQVGISPELTQAAYRVGDSVTNIVTPLNPYVVIILVFVQRYMARAGIGTLVALMLPYAICFMLVWSTLLVVWMLLGLDLGPAGPLRYPSQP